MTLAGPIRAFVEELVLAGIREVVICPGSRSMPLALALRTHPGLRTWVHLDERAGAFFALGMAKASRRAVAVLGTSGTAVVEFGPAVAEAHEARVPLVVLTADRPPELRDRGAPQAIDQTHVFGRFAKWFTELPVPEAGDVLEAHVRGVAARAVAVAEEAPAGPVQVNVPFRDPLVPTGSLRPEPASAQPYVDVVAGPRTVTAAQLDRLAGGVADARRGAIVCGPLDVPGFAEAVAQLAGATGFPVLADALANVRSGTHDRSSVIARHDAILRSASFRDAHRPDLVIRFGGTPTSKALTTWIAGSGAPGLVVDEGGWNEPTLGRVTMVHGEPREFARALAERVVARGAARNDTWLRGWQAADRAADSAIRTWLGGVHEPFEGRVWGELPDAVPADAILFAGNSMPVRDLDAFLSPRGRTVRCLANRGANGIDGLISTALGVAAVEEAPVVLVIGDVSFVHDLNALVAARLLGSRLTMVVTNNDGGGIFSFLPQAEVDLPDVGLPEHFEEVMGTPHGVDIPAVATALGAEHRAVGWEPGVLAAAVADSVGRPGVRVLEVRTDRARNVALHRDCQAAVAAALERLPVHA